MANIGPGYFSNFGATPGIAQAGPPVAVGVPNLYDSTNVQQTVTALYAASQAGGLGPPSESGGVIATGDIPQNVQWQGASLVLVGTPYQGNNLTAGTVTNWNQTHAETSTQAALSEFGAGGTQPAQNAPVTYNGTAWANAGSYKWA
jgi:hypothetical protein